jgi:hypothetical protein
MMETFSYFKYSTAVKCLRLGVILLISTRNYQQARRDDMKLGRFRGNGQVEGMLESTSLFEISLEALYLH